MARPFLPDSVFWLHVAISPFDEACWPWIGEVTRRGYGYTRFRGKSNVLAHRVAYQLEYGLITDETKVLHSCDWRRCCNPYHLFVGTQLDNVRDMHAKGRAGDCRNFGEDHGRCVVSDAQVAEMKRLYGLGDHTQAALASIFKVSATQVSRIVRGESRAILTADARRVRRT